MANKINFEELATRFIQGGNYSIGDIWPDPDPILKKMNKDATAYADIRSDAKVSACIESRKAGTTSMEWSLEKTDKTNSYEVIEQALKKLDLTNIISQALEAVLWGYQPLEVIWEKQDKYILPKAVIAKPAEWFIFDTENKLRLKTKNNQKGEQLPERKFLIAQHNPTYANPYGDKVISRCFWPITFKKGGWKFWVTFSEKYGMPFLLGKVPRGTNIKEQDELLETLIALASDAVGVIPNDSTIDFIESKNGGSGSSSNSFKELIEQCNSEIALAIVGQTLSSEVGSTGSYAASKTHNDVRKEIIDADKKMVEGVINQLCRWIHEINFSNGEAPVFSLWQETDIDKELAERDKILTETGVKFSKEYYIRTYGLKEEDFDLVIQQAPVASAATIQKSGAQFAAPTTVEKYDPEKAQTASAKDMNTISEQLTKKVLDLIEKSDNYEQVMHQLFKLFPEIDTGTLEDSLGKALYVAAMEGQIND